MNAEETSTKRRSVLVLCRRITERNREFFVASKCDFCGVGLVATFEGGELIKDGGSPLCHECFEAHMAYMQSQAMTVQILPAAKRQMEDGRADQGQVDVVLKVAQRGGIV